MSRDRQPLLIGVVGLPGSGDEALAEALAQHLDVALLAAAPLHRAMFGERQPAEAEDAVAGALWAAVRALLMAGEGLVLQGLALADGSGHAHAQGLAAAYGAELLLVGVEISQRLAIERLAAAGVARAALRVRRAAAARPAWPAGLLRVDGSASTARQVEVVLERLQTGIARRSL